MPYDFTTPKSATGRATKWAKMSNILGKEPADDALAMWVAQMDFQPAPFLLKAMDTLRDEGELGYFTGLEKFQEKVAWWYQTRFGWAPDPGHVLPTHGIGNAVGMTLQCLTNPGDGIIIFTPVYNEFTAKVKRNGRKVVESPLIIDEDGLFQMDLATLETQLTGSEKLVLISSPHNPAGRTFEAEELRALGDFCNRHDLLLASDEIHMDLVFPGAKHVPTALAAPEVIPRLIVMSAASKTFDIAGLRTGYVIIPDGALRERFRKFHHALDIQANRMGLEMTIAAYSEEGAAWTDELVKTLHHNAQNVSDRINAIPGLKSAPMQGTYLAWIDAKNTGIDQAEFQRRIFDEARVVASPGPMFGTGGDVCMRLNIGAPEARVNEALARIEAAFADLQ